MGTSNTAVTPFDLEIEVSGMCFFVILEPSSDPHAPIKERALYAVMPRQHGHDAAIYVNKAEFNPPIACGGKDDSEGSYVEYPLSHDIDWPSEVVKTGIPPFPLKLANVTALTNGLRFDRGLLANSNAILKVPLNFGSVEPVEGEDQPGHKTLFDYCDEKGNRKPANEPLAYKFRFRARVEANQLLLNVRDANANNCIVALTPQRGRLEIRIKNLPHKEDRGRDPIPGDTGDARHFRAFYSLLKPKPAAGLYMPVPMGDECPDGKGPKPQSTLYTCMPGGGS